MLMEIDLGFKTEVDTFELWSSEFCFIFIKNSQILWEQLKSGDHPEGKIGGEKVKIEYFSCTATSLLFWK